MTRTDKLKARIPRGFRDRLGAEIVAEREMLARISAVYEVWGFDPLETPTLEYTDALGKFLPDIDRPNEGVFSLQDDDEQWMSLRYDLTAPSVPSGGSRSRGRAVSASSLNVTPIPLALQRPSPTPSASPCSQKRSRRQASGKRTS